MMRRGFTIVELIITITIMGILLTLAVVNVAATQVKARDDERKSDVQTISTYLNTFYTSGATNAPIITNSSADPKSTGGTWGNNNGAVWATTAATITDHPVGITTAIKSQLKAGQTNATVLSLYNVDGMVNSTTPRSVGVWAFVNAPGYESYFVGGAETTHIPLTPNTWTYIQSTTALSGYIGFYIGKTTGNAGSADIGYATGSMTVSGPQAYDYNDGNSPGWSWAGTPNASTSSGPSITGGPGVYPSTSLTLPSLLTVYLPDADTKAFTAPGKSDPYATFISAANAVQTPSGVLPQPTIDQYIYQPIDASGNLCYSGNCRKYNIYYRLEADNTVYKVTSKNQ